MILSFGSLFVSCDDTLTLQSIKVTQKPTAEYQYLGESLDKTGMVVTGYYNKGYESVIADYTVSPEKFETLGINTVTVSYKGKTDSFEVNVVRNDLESITIKNPPNKIAYKSGEKLTLTGMVVEANYKDGTVETITGYTTTPVEGTRLKTTNKKVIISYQDKTTEQSIVVVETPEPTPTPTYKITYNGNGNTSGTAPSEKTGCVYGADVTLAGNTGLLVKQDTSTTPATNYVFAGWNTKDDGTGTSYAAGAEVENGFTGDTTLYAKWLKLNPIGGRVFYMFYDNGLTYTFYDSTGHVFDGTKGYELVQANTDDSNAIRNKDLNNNWNKVAYYTVEGARTDNTADKFYVYEKTLGNNGLVLDKEWGAYQIDVGSDGEAPRLDGIGQGKVNTATALGYAAAHPDTHPNPFESGNSSPYGDATIWTWLDTVNTCDRTGATPTYGNGTGGCTDWFIPSKLELDMLRFSGLVDWFSNKYIWSSVENADVNSWYWYYGDSAWYGYGKYTTGNVVAVRAF